MIQIRILNLSLVKITIIIKLVILILNSIRNPAGNFINASNIRLINNASADCFKEAILSITGGSALEYTTYLGQVSTIMRLLTSEDSDLSSCFDKNGENALNDNNVLKKY